MKEPQRLVSCQGEQEGGLFAQGDRILFISLRPVKASLRWTL